MSSTGRRTHGTDDPLEFADVCDRTDAPNRSLLMGNGFSIACTSSFDYRRLLDAADFGSSSRNRRMAKLFEQSETSDFEAIVRRLDNAADTVRLYRDSTLLRKRMRRDAKEVRSGLAGAVAAVHPRRIGTVGDARLDQCSAFLRDFGQLFTLNYDALLHWARMRSPDSFDDGFRRRDQRLVHAEPERQTVFWLHGALHLREAGWFDDEPATVKAAWDDNGPLIDYVRDAIEAKEYPLVVTEGSWEQKVRAIRRSPYLTWCHDSLASTSGALVTFGWGMNPNDEHILAAIAGSNISELYIGVRGGTPPVDLAKWRASADVLEARSGKRLSAWLWDTDTAVVW